MTLNDFIQQLLTLQAEHGNKPLFVDADGCEMNPDIMIEENRIIISFQ